MYFPQYYVTLEIIKDLKESDETGENLSKFIRILLKKQMIKINSDMIHEIQNIDLSKYEKLDLNVKKRNRIVRKLEARVNL